MSGNKMGPAAGPDRGWSWVVAFACCFSSFVLAGIFRTSGVLFVAFISTFGVSREGASWPMAVCISVLNLAGPLSGLLGQRYGVRPVVLAGSVVATLGISACYLTTSLNVITVLFGGVFGVGYGFMNTLMPGILNAYFLNLRATANGIANSGSCIGSMILPVVFEYFISTYGLSGCFLLTGGMVLHIAIAASLMRQPSWLVKTNSHLKDTHLLLNRDLVGTRTLVADLNKRDRNASVVINYHASSMPSRKTVEIETVVTRNSVFSVPGTLKVCTDSKEADSLCETNLFVKQSNFKTVKAENSDLKNVTSNLSVKAQYMKTCKKNSLQGNDHSEIQQNFQKSESPYKYETESDPETSVGSRPVCSNCNSCLCNCKSFLGIFHTFLTVLTCPMFYITAVTNVSFYFLYHMYVVIIVDYALDNGVQDTKTKYILVFFSVADLAGRLCFGWVTDHRLVSRSRFVMVCMTMIGFVFFMFPMAKDYWSLVAASCCYGLLLGCTMVVFPILLVDFLGIELHAVSYGCMCFMNGFASFGRPFLIGYFRDSLGSYSSMFYALGALSIVASTLWLMEKLIDRKKSISSS